MIVDGKYHDGVSPDSAMEILRGLPAEKEAAETEAEA